jgi:hypothetical protein
MITISTSSFTVTGANEYECMVIMIECLCMAVDDFAEYMGVNSEELDKAPKWALNYLKDIIDVNLVRLGYVMEDSKQKGIMGEYNESSSKLINNGDTRKIVINKEYILNKENTLKVSLITMIHLINIKKSNNIYFVG